MQVLRGAAIDAQPRIHTRDQQRLDMRRTERRPWFDAQGAISFMFVSFAHPTEVRGSMYTPLLFFVSGMYSGLVRTRVWVNANFAHPGEINVRSSLACFEYLGSGVWQPRMQSL